MCQLRNKTERTIRRCVILLLRGGRRRQSRIAPAQLVLTYSSLEDSLPAGSDRTGTEAGWGQPDPDLPKLVMSVHPLARAKHSTRVGVRLCFRREQCSP
jgi:hypothetical protein